MKLKRFLRDSKNDAYAAGEFDFLVSLCLG
jgi:hypothetical protein